MELELPEFKQAIEFLGKDYSKEKLTEHIERVKEIETFI
jgi:hypothetical protein